MSILSSLDLKAQESTHNTFLLYVGTAFASLEVNLNLPDSEFNLPRSAIAMYA